VSMNPIDTWRGIEGLEAQGWNEQAINGALAIPARAVRKLKLLGALHPPMLDFMAKGSMPTDDQLRTIANASADEQAEVWKLHKPKKGHDVGWWEVARALSKRRIAFSAAKFDDKIAVDYGVTWEEDLFSPAGAENRYTTNAEGFFAAQQAHMLATLPTNGTMLTVGEYGAAQLPKGAERIYSTPKKSDLIGHYIDERDGEIKTIAYRMPPPKAKAAAGKDGTVTTGGEAIDDSGTVVKIRPDVTQKGMAMVGQFRTDALHKALDDSAIPTETLLGLLVIAFAGKNVAVQSPQGMEVTSRLQVLSSICEGGVLSIDSDAIHTAARAMLKLVLSCRDNMTDSGIASRIAGDALCANQHLPHMATEEFLSCLSRAALERATKAENVSLGTRVKDTRAALVQHADGSTWHFPGARFELMGTEFANGTHEYRYERSSHFVAGTSSGNADGGAEDDAGDDEADPSEDGAEVIATDDAISNAA